MVGLIMDMEKAQQIHDSMVAKVISASERGTLKLKLSVKDNDSATLLIDTFYSGIGDGITAHEMMFDEDNTSFMRKSLKLLYDSDPQSFDFVVKNYCYNGEQIL